MNLDQAREEYRKYLHQHAYPLWLAEEPHRLYSAACEQAVANERKRVAEVLSSIVISEGDDAGVILLSDESPADWSDEHQCHVYRHEHFSPLGDALVELAKSVSIAKGE